MDTTPKADWLKLNPTQIEAVQHRKREEEKERSKQIHASLCNLEGNLLKCINSLHCAEQNLMQGGHACTDPFIENIENYIDGLQNIGHISTRLDNIAFPITLCDYIDQGKSTDLQMKQNYNITKSRNNLQRARIVNTHTIQQYLKNGQEYFNEWSLKQKDSQQQDHHDDDNDVGMK
eukprot:269088_1